MRQDFNRAEALPAFIGYTEFARNGGNSLLNKPWRISSMSEYVRYFGGAPSPVFKLEDITAAAPDAGTPDATAPRGQATVFEMKGKKYKLSRQANKAGGRFLMHQAMTHFFQNGGGACYIVSVGNYTGNNGIEAGDETKGLIGGLTPLIKEQEPTMVLTPDAVLLSEADCVLVQQQVMAHCGGKMRNRVAADPGVTELLCATHGAAYQPDTGECAGGPCRGGLVKIAVDERDGVVHWHTAPHLQPIEF